MNSKILYVHGAGERRPPAELLEAEFELDVAGSEAEALALCEERGPFAVVISAEELGGASGLALLERLQARWPRTQSILLGGTEQRSPDPERRALPRSASVDELLDAARSALLRAHLDDLDQLADGELHAARGAVLHLAEALEARLDDRLLRLRALGDLATGINAAESLAQVAAVTARMVSATLGGCGVEVSFDGGCTTGRAGTRVGPDFGERIFEVPLVCGDLRLGHLRVDLDSHPRGTISSADRQFLISVAASAAGGAGHHIRREERDEAQHATVLGLARLAEHRDDETGKHLDRVSQFCRTIALALREHEKYRDVIDERFLTDIVHSAPLHDIGKVGIPDSILLKPGKLTEEEWVEMRKHPTIGAETLRPLVERSTATSHLSMGLDIAWCHHEKWNGEGYPRGLAGEGIPLSARILALADCYDALTTRRPYKEPWLHSEAVAYVSEQSGAHFDPDVVAAFLEQVEEIDAIRQRLADEASDESRSRAAS